MVENTSSSESHRVLESVLFNFPRHETGLFGVFSIKDSIFSLVMESNSVNRCINSILSMETLVLSSREETLARDNDVVFLNASERTGN